MKAKAGRKKGAGGTIVVVGAFAAPAGATPPLNLGLTSAPSRAYVGQNVNVVVAVRAGPHRRRGDRRPRLDRQVPAESYVQRAPRRRPSATGPSTR
jgi:hypothetical protein